jgi:dCMP deaminase
MINHERIGWDELWLSVADLVSKRSVDQKLKVGCIIVSIDNTRVLSLGYNGDEKGGLNARDSMESGKSGFIHAEINALIKSDFNSIDHKKMYITHSPCIMCSKAIINAGIKEVYFKKVYDLYAIEFLNKYIPVIKR